MDNLDLAFISLLVLGAIVGLVIGIFMHEMGHATAAYLNSWPISKIALGAGPILFKANERNNFPAIELRLIPRSGVVFAKIPRGATKPQRLLFAGGGVLVNLVLLPIALTNYYLTDDLSLYRGFWLEFALVQLMLIGSLWPRYGTVNGIKFKSDGLQIWHILQNRSDLDIPNSWNG